MTANTQLSLFDASTAVETTYKVGDLVKLKRKTPHAACLKKGDIIQIEAIHPRDGSCKFWNERTESWGYVYPDEFFLVGPAEIDSVTSEVVTESKVEPAEIDSVTSEVVTESTDSRAIATYSPKGTARSGQYFRFSYKQDRRVKHVHIPGGNTDSPIAQTRVQEVRSLIAAGVPPVQVAVTIRSWRGGTTHKPLSD